MSANEVRCETCRFFERNTVVEEETECPEDQTAGECHRYPPVMQLTEGFSTGAFPYVYDVNWCGEWRAAVRSTDGSDQKEAEPINKTPVELSILAMSLRHVDMPHNLRERLAYEGINTVGELCSKRTLDIRNVGPLARARLFSALEKLGVEPLWSSTVPVTPPDASP